MINIKNIKGVNKNRFLFFSRSESGLLYHGFGICSARYQGIRSCFQDTGQEMGLSRICIGSVAATEALTLILLPLPFGEGLICLVAKGIYEVFVAIDCEAGFILTLLVGISATSTTLTSYIMLLLLHRLNRSVRESRVVGV